jgi:hypothetical protein
MGTHAPPEQYPWCRTATLHTPALKLPGSQGSGPWPRAAMPIAAATESITLVDLRIGAGLAWSEGAILVGLQNKSTPSPSRLRKKANRRGQTGVHPWSETTKLGTGYRWLVFDSQQDRTIVHFWWRAKRRRAMLESKPPRNSSLETHPDDEWRR